jgi:hypothetical protein
MRGKGALDPQEITEQETEIDREIEITDHEKGIPIETEVVRDMPRESEESTIVIDLEMTLESIPKEEREVEVVIERDPVVLVIMIDGDKEEVLRLLLQALHQVQPHPVRGGAEVPRGDQEDKS